MKREIVLRDRTLLINGFLELLAFYWKSMYVLIEENIFTQKKGVYFESVVAPVLSDILLEKVYRFIESCVEEIYVKSLRYVDGILVLRHNGTNSVEKVESVFKVSGEGLNFLKRVPEQDVLQFLDVSLKCGEGDDCSWYNPRAKKTILTYEYANPKCVKKGIMSGYLESPLKRSRYHLMGHSIEHQLTK